MSGEFCGLEGCICPDPVGEMHQEWLIPTTKCADGQFRGNQNFYTRETAEKFRDEHLPKARIYVRWTSSYELDEPIDPATGRYSCCGTNALSFDAFHAAGCPHRQARVDTWGHD